MKNTFSNELLPFWVGGLGPGSLGFAEDTGHDLEEPLSDFLLDNRDWITGQRAFVSWYIVKKLWAEAVVIVTPGELRPQINVRLAAAGFRTRVPKVDRHLDGHLLYNKPATSIQVLGRFRQ